MIKVLIFNLLVAAISLGQLSASDHEYVVLETANPEYRANKVFSEPEDLTSPQFDVLLSRYNLKEIVKDEADEFNRILLLRNWLNKYLVIDRSRPVAKGGVLKMLADGPGGGSYSCGHFEAIQNAVMNAMGYVTRCVLSGPDGTEPDLTGSHGSNEVWCNTLCKWVMVDAELDSHFEKDGVPLSALELRDAYLADGGQGVVRVRGPEKEQLARGRHDQWGNTPKAYAFISWRQQANRFSIWPEVASSVEIVYNDEFFQKHIWHKSGEKHWAYDAGKFIRIENKNGIYWTPNVLDLDVNITGNVAHVGIRSSTPNFKEYQMKADGDDWKLVDRTINLELFRPREEFAFRSVNLAGVAGPVYKLVIGKSNL